jgi:epoxyqueuosine reductase
VRSAGLAAGLDAVGIASAEPFVSTRRDLETRKRDGLHGGMAFTYRRPERSTDASLTLPGARALVVGARGYLRARQPEMTGRASGRVARYAWHDLYAELRTALGAVALRLEVAGWQARVVADDNALVDREAARRAGIGWYGKNANILLPGQGSWFVLGSVITDAPLPPAEAPIEDGCGVCTRCLSACPTDAIVAPGVVDARRCLAWLLQAEGDFPLDMRARLGDRLYGCDDCQEVCPPNRRRPATEPAPPEAMPWVDVLGVLAADDDALLETYGRWYIPRRQPRYIRRNALVVLGNVGDIRDPEVRAALARYREDPDPMLREHARWATEQLATVGA